MVVFWRLRSPGANGRLVAAVKGNCGDEFDHGAIGICGGGSDLSPDGHFIVDSSDVLTVLDNDCSMNGIRPALWLRTK